MANSANPYFRVCTGLFADWAPSARPSARLAVRLRRPGGAPRCPDLPDDQDLKRHGNSLPWSIAVRTRVSPHT